MSCYWCVSTACYCSNSTTPIVTETMTEVSRMSARAFGVFEESWKWSQNVKLPNSHRITSLNSYDKFAHYLHGFVTKEKYIITPTPEYEKMDDFIDMILEQNAKIVVMPGGMRLNGAEERYCYWNSSPQNAQSNSKYEMKLVATSFRKYYTIIDLTIRSTQSAETCHTIKVFQFALWLDIGIPVGRRYFGAFIEEVNVANGTDFFGKETLSPIIVHCNNVGYAGTFCALDICMEQWILRRQVDVDKVIEHVCQGRYTGNINEYQSTFILEAIAQFASLVQ